MTLHTFHPSPIGPLLLVGEPDGSGGVRLTRILMEDQKHSVPVGAGWQEDGAAFAEVTRQLDEYFTGGRHDFSLSLSPSGTAFQLAVWDELRRIPTGRTTTYGEIAARLGRPSASRAVGAAVGRNPIAVVVPCHRVIGSSGGLTGFAGGLERKRALLALEGALAG